MHRLYWRHVILWLAAIAADSAHAQQPPDIVTSDEFQNIAVGPGALADLVATAASGANTAVGFNALFYNTTGTKNTASGDQTLLSNSLGSWNSGYGFQTLYFNTTGSYNTAFGALALGSNSTGAGNSACGFNALRANASGNQNTANGLLALQGNTVGDNNTAVGYDSLHGNISGSNNIAIGALSGFNLTTGSDNIIIGAAGSPGDHRLIRIGAESTHTEVYVAGISHALLTGAAIYVTGQGRLGVLAASESSMTDIQPIGARTEQLQQLRPVSFRSKTNPDGEIQYGLIAEEVDRVYPELVIRDETGVVQGVHYEELAPLLLRELQRQAVEIRDLKRQVAKVNELENRLNAAVKQLKPKDELVALR